MDADDAMETGIEIGDILLGYLELVLPPKIVDLIKLAFKKVTRFALDKNRASVRRARTVLDGWAKSENIEDGVLLQAAETAMALLAEAGTVTGDRLVAAHGSATALAEMVTGNMDRFRLDAGGNAATFRIVESVLTAALEDGELRSAIEFELVVDIAGQVHRAATVDTARPGLVDGDMARLENESRYLVRRRTVTSHDRAVQISATTDAAGRWLGTTPWRDRVAIAAKAVTDAVGNLASELASLSVRTTLSDEDVRLNLVDARPASILKRVAAKRPDAVGALTNLEWLVRESTSPRFERTLAITGSWKSGKSTVAWNVAEAALESKAIVLAPTRVLGHGLEGALNLSLEHALGRSAARFRSVASDLGAHNKLTLVVIDDAHEWAMNDNTFVAELVELMRASYGRGEVRWIVTADVLQLDSLYHGTDREYWSSSAAPRKSAREDAGGAWQIEGWIDLGEVNRIEMTGHRLMAAEALAEDRPSVEAYANLPVESRDQNWWLLCQPLPASMWLRDTAVALTQFDEARFAEVYWREAERELDLLGHSPRLIKSMIADLTVGVALSEGLPILRGDLENQVLRPLATFEDADLFDALLGDLAGLRLVELGGDMVEASAESLWGARLASEFENIRFRGEVALIGAMLPWMGDAEPRVEFLRDAVVREWIISLANEPALAMTTERICINMLVSGQRTAPLWGAALRLQDSLQIALATALVRHQHVARNPHELYLFLRWCLYMSSDVWSPLVALRHISASVPLALSSGLNGYASAVVERFARMHASDTASALTDLLQVLFGMSALDSSSRLIAAGIASSTGPGAAERVATAAWEVARNVHYVPGSSPESEIDFVGSLVKSAAEAAVDGDVDRAEKAFRDAGWFSSEGLNQQTHALLRNEAHVALGHAFSDQSQNVVGLVERISRGPGANLNSAIFIIRHTRSTSGEKSLKVSPLLHPGLRLLKERERELDQEDLRWLRPLLVANGIS